jgi:hypothetical protein
MFVWIPNKPHAAKFFLRNQHLLSHSRNFQHFIEPEGSLPCLQEWTWLVLIYSGNNWTPVLLFTVHHVFSVSSLFCLQKMRTSLIPELCFTGLIFDWLHGHVMWWGICTLINTFTKLQFQKWYPTLSTTIFSSLSTLPLQCQSCHTL